jgi:hypothetical protein
MRQDSPIGLGIYKLSIVMGGKSYHEKKVWMDHIFYMFLFDSPGRVLKRENENRYG